MKILVFLIILTIFLTSTTNAGLDNTDVAIAGLAFYDFETVKKDDQRGKYVENNILSFNLNGYLYDGATTTAQGDFGKCLYLRQEALLSAGTSLFPNSFNVGFSTVAWVKLQQQSNVFVFSMLAANGNDITGGISLFIAPSGNLKGVESGLPVDAGVAIESEDLNVADNEWHHIAYTKYYHTYSLYVDGELVRRIRSVKRPKFQGENFLISIFAIDSLIGKVYVDEVAFFQTNFSTYEIKGIYKDGFEKFLEEMPVNSQGRLTTTWSEIKSRR